MTLSSIFSPKSIFSYLGITFAWILIWLCLGTEEFFFAVFGFAATVALVWGVYALIKSHGKGELLKSTEKEAVHVLSYSIALTILLATVWPRVIFGNFFLPTHAVIWLYLVPAFFVCFATLHALHHLFSENKIHILPAIIFGLVCAVIVAGLASAYVEVQVLPKILGDSHNAPLLDEYKPSALTANSTPLLTLLHENWQTQYTELEETTSQISSNRYEEAEKQVIAIIQLFLTKSQYQQAVEQREIIESESFVLTHPDVPTQLEELQTYLNAHGDALTTSSFDEISWLQRADNAQTPNDFQHILHDFDELSGNTNGELGGLSTLYPQDKQFTLTESVQYAAMHTSEAKEILHYVTRLGVIIRVATHSSEKQKTLVEFSKNAQDPVDRLVASRLLAKDTCRITNDYQCEILQ